jgi:ribonuclease I
MSFTLLQLLELFVFLQMMNGFNKLQQTNYYYNTNFYYLSVQKQYNNSSYTIHGLWPNYANGSYPSYCYDIHLDLDKLEEDTDLYMDMNTSWFSFEGDNQEFWNHEVNKHYSCLFNRTMTQLEYFQTAIDIYLNISDNLSELCYDSSCLIPYDLEFNLL